VDNPKIEEYLGVDVGAARIGIARGNSAARLAEPLKTVAATDAAPELLVNLPFYWQDEALTSQAADKIQNSKSKAQNIDEHSLAAAIILQDFLDGAENDRVAV
jgi:RNase H-fold protein (predicted Holliday junction resolvase)